jgi:ferredoxin-NADP reductase
LRQAATHQLPHHLLLLYSNCRPEDAAFLSELQELEQQNKNFRLLATMTNIADSVRKWNGAVGYVNADMVKSCVRERAAPICYVVGPPAMVKAMQNVLSQAGVSEDDVRTEEFYGY